MYDGTKFAYSDIANWHDIAAMGKSSGRAVKEEKRRDSEANA